MSFKDKSTDDLFVDHLIFPAFEDIPVSTKTFIVYLNLDLNIDNMFENLPITPYEMVKKKRGRKKKSLHDENMNKGIKDGSIITMEYKKRFRGVNTKSVKKHKKCICIKTCVCKQYFRNSITVVMIIEDKKVNFKISNNGKFQMTGCKHDHHAEKCVYYIWKYLKQDETLYKKKEDNENPPHAIFIPAMRNIDFSLGFNVNRGALDTYINTKTDYHSLLEESFGYTGVNIKMPLLEDITKLVLKDIHYIEDKETGDILQEVKSITYGDYLKLLDEKDRRKKMKKIRRVTFLVFHSGKCIMSGVCAELSKQYYYKFTDIVRNCFNKIEERLVC